jgi:4-hydroxybenzoate polyprenyltransferase
MTQSASYLSIFGTIVIFLMIFLIMLIECCQILVICRIFDTDSDAKNERRKIVIPFRQYGILIRQ